MTVRSAEAEPLTRAAADRSDDPELIEIGLVFATDAQPGISRIRRGKGFSYHLPGGERITDARVLARIQRLGLPPAYRRVWISLDARSHLQATGFDARDRKQYRYHADWASWRNERKFDDLVRFGRALPAIRRRVISDLEARAQEAHFLMAALISLLDATHMRVGNRAYAEENRTYGATTLQKRHITFEQDGIRLSFVAKGGKRIRRKLRHPRLQRILEEIADLPGRDLFSWRDQAGDLHRIDSGRLNTYLGDIAGNGLSAKTFRTWGGSVAAFGHAWRQIRTGEHPSIKDMCQVAADRLHNTPGICRSSYVHPRVLQLADRRTDLDMVCRAVEVTGGHGMLRADERRLMALLEMPPDGFAV